MTDHLVSRDLARKLGRGIGNSRKRRGSSAKNRDRRIGVQRIGVMDRTRRIRIQHDRSIFPLLVRRQLRHEREDRRNTSARDIIEIGIIRPSDQRTARRELLRVRSRNRIDPRRDTFTISNGRDTVRIGSVRLHDSEECRRASTIIRGELSFDALQQLHRGRRLPDRQV